MSLLGLLWSMASQCGVELSTYTMVTLRWKPIRGSDYTGMGGGWGGGGQKCEGQYALGFHLDSHICIDKSTLTMNTGTSEGCTPNIFDRRWGREQKIS